MSWFWPQRTGVPQEHLDAILAENSAISSRVEASAEEIKEHSDAERQALAATIADTRKRRDARESRLRERAKRDPSLAAVNDVIRILEGH
ncbi:hypothetical protein [Methylobacterium sp. B4]|uniref:hypothetical protein n=1 Tax=Methylobacterium sp. B4 TaxID=1938755 RepID=UPI000D8E80D0|nr:hypothetical protein [Methylobacterium sp. B4]PXW51308.1 hypothetical protein BY998_13529 [Methylobacterium sp. B4]